MVRSRNEGRIIWNKVGYCDFISLAQPLALLTHSSRGDARRALVGHSPAAIFVRGRRATRETIVVAITDSFDPFPGIPRIYRLPRHHFHPLLHFPSSDSRYGLYCQLPAIGSARVDAFSSATNMVDRFFYYSAIHECAFRFQVFFFSYCCESCHVDFEKLIWIFRETFVKIVKVGAKFFTVYLQIFI